MYIVRRLKTMNGFGPRIQQSVDAKADGLLLHDNLLFSLFAADLGIRQYWRDFESLERWTRSEPHRIWWQNFLKDSGGTGFFQEVLPPDLFHARWDGSHIRRHESFCRQIGRAHV